MQEPIVYLNGELLPISEARIPVLDRGFIFGDGVYDVVPFYAGKAFRADHHYARLFRSMQAIGIPNPHDRGEWEALVGKVVDAFGPHDQMVYIQVTRGVAKRAHAFPKEPVTPTVFIMTNAMVLPTTAVREKGVRCVTMEDQRWLHCDIKSISLLGNILAAQHAAEHDALEAIQFRDGFLTEASSSNVWIVKNGVVSVPPTDHLILKGIRYDLLHELCTAAGIPFDAARVTRAQVFDADEVMLTSATKEVLPVVQIDDKPVGNGQPGPIFRKLYEGYQRAKAQ